MSGLVRWLQARRKAAASLVAALLAWGPVAQADGFTARDWWALAVLIAGVLGVHEAANDNPVPGEWDPPVRDSGQGLVSVLMAILLLLLILALLGAIHLHPVSS